MNIKKFFVVLCILGISATVPFSIIYAQDGTNLTQAYINAQNINLFISGDFNSESLGLKVANKIAEIKDSGSILEKEIPVRTTVLVDISASMPIESRDKVHELIENKIKNIEKNEEIGIIAFGAKTNVLQNFTSDRYDLSTAAAEIEFNGTQSALYDTIFNTLPEIKTYDEKPCFYRTIVITDGADFTPGGITKEELFMRLQTETYPIDVICVSANIPQNQDKDLAALTRISSGRYFELYPETDVYELTSGLSVGDYFWVRAEVPVELLDGSTRQVDVFDGNNSISFDMKMSVVDEQIEQSSQTAQNDLTTDIVDSSASSENLSSNRESMVESISDEKVIIIIIAASAVTLIVVIIVIIALKKKKKPNLVPPDSVPKNNIYNREYDTSSATELYFENTSDERFSIKISNADNPSENWITNVSGDVLIGRDKNCLITINDTSVSHEQCKIFVKNDGLAVINLSRSNVTKLNGMVVSNEPLLHPGDNLKLGRITLRVDYIQKIGVETPPPNNTPRNSNSGYTESIFR